MGFKREPKFVSRYKRKVRIRKKIAGTAECPRLSVFRSARHIYAQIVDDSKGLTLVSASTLDKELKGSEFENKTAAAVKIGKLVAERAKARGIEKVVFDRNGYIYHGRVKALSEGAREAGLNF
ncbi:MAG: 50S ribosomal protein L18 [Desulforegulaceae bacterium]|jgi:large subunit ribosomal protein L18|nr:50S ribosomal protein L18 [Desulforegulaceae bacterium]